MGGLSAELQCPCCGRDFAGDDVLRPGDDCPADECPSHWEEVGIPHPDFPSVTVNLLDAVNAARATLGQEG